MRTSKPLYPVNFLFPKCIHFLATRRAQHYSKAGSKDDLIPLKNRQFTYQELVAVTNNFQRILGKGGFGTVYHGLLENGVQVAVKKRKESTVQGIGDFLTEVIFNFSYNFDLHIYALTHLVIFNFFFNLKT